MSEAVIQRLKISREGVILIKSFEGFRPRAVRRDDGGWVIGYGHTLSAREGATVAEADAELLLQYDLIPVAKAVNEGVVAPLNQHQFDALASFAFSVGVDRFQTSDVLSRLNAGFSGEAADALIGWPEPVVAETALRRRAAERALFVANPSLPVALADLLAAPLPPPYRGPVEPPVPTPAASVEPEVPAEYLAPDLAQETVHEPEQTFGQSARHAAVAALLAEPDPVLHAPEAETEVAEASKPVIEPAGFAALEPETAPAEADLAEADPTAAELTESDLAEAPSAPDVAPSEPPVTPTPAPVPTPPTFSNPLPMQRYSAYSGVIVGPLPGPIPSLRFSPPVSDTATGPAPIVDGPADERSVEPEAASPLTAPAPSDPAPSAPTPSDIASADTVVAETAGETVERADETPAEEALPPEAPTDVTTAARTEVTAEASAEVPAAPAPATAWFVDSASAIAAAPTESGTEVDPFAHVTTPEPEAAPEPTAPVVAGSEPVQVQPEAEAPAPIETPVFAAVEAPAELNPFALPPAPSPVPAAASLAPLEMPVFGAPVPTPAPAPIQGPTADPWPAITATSEPRTDGELILTPSPEAEVFASPRLVWPHGEQAGDDTSPLFEDDGSLRLAPGNILRHEIIDDAAEPARIPWGELAAYGVMGGFGLVSFGMSMAAFRRAAGESSGGDGTVLIAIVLAVVGAACVGVSAYNLYRRWGRTDEE